MDQTHEDELTTAAINGDERATAELFDHHRERLRQMVKLRLDRRVRGRVDPSDVLQEAFLEVRKRLPSYAQGDKPPFFLWLRLVVGQKLVDLHRHHLGVQMRNANRDISINNFPMPEASSVAIAAKLLGKMTSPSQAAQRWEVKVRIQSALDQMDPIDREVLTLRHFEMLTNAETAQVLELSHAAASNRYVRALKRMKEIVSEEKA